MSIIARVRNNLHSHHGFFTANTPDSSQTIFSFGAYNGIVTKRHVMQHNKPIGELEIFTSGGDVHSFDPNVVLSAAAWLHYSSCELKHDGEGNLVPADVTKLTADEANKLQRDMNDRIGHFQRLQMGVANLANVAGMDPGYRIMFAETFQALLAMEKDQCGYREHRVSAVETESDETSVVLALYDGYITEIPFMSIKMSFGVFNFCFKEES